MRAWRRPAMAVSVAHPPADFRRQRPSGFDLDRPATPVGRRVSARQPPAARHGRAGRFARRQRVRGDRLGIVAPHPVPERLLEPAALYPRPVVAPAGRGSPRILPPIIVKEFSRLRRAKGFDKSPEGRHALLGRERGGGATHSVRTQPGWTRTQEMARGARSIAALRITMFTTAFELR